MMRIQSKPSGRSARIGPRLSEPQQPRVFVSALAALLAIGCASQLLAQPIQDLPFTSTSTETDGALRLRWAPNPSYQGAMVYDTARQQIVLFGGYRAGTLNETYLWNGTNWTQASPFTLPGSRYAHAMAYDAARQKVI